MRGAFVAMPFGEKTYERRKVDCDATFAKVIVPVLEDADLGLETRGPAAWTRASSSVGMMGPLGNADIVVVDTITENANVFYELGLLAVRSPTRPRSCSGQVGYLAALGYPARGSRPGA